MDEFTPRGESVYESFKKHFQDHGFHFEARDEDHVITATFGGDDLPMPLLIRVIDDREVVKLISSIPMKIPEEKRVDAAIAITAINYQLLNGCFQMDLSDGEVRYSMAQSFCESDVNEEMIRYLIGVTIKTTDEYNDRFFMLGKGLMSLDQFLEAV